MLASSRKRCVHRAPRWRRPLRTVRRMRLSRTQRPKPMGSISLPTTGRPSRCGRPGRHADEPTIEHQNGDVAVARGMATGRRDDRAHADLAPGEVFAAELDAHVSAGTSFGSMSPLGARGDAVVRGQHSIVLDQRARAGDCAGDHAHDVVVLGRRARAARRVAFELPEPRGKLPGAACCGLVMPGSRTHTADEREHHEQRQIVASGTDPPRSAGRARVAVRSLIAGKGKDTLRGEGSDTPSNKNGSDCTSYARAGQSPVDHARVAATAICRGARPRPIDVRMVVGDVRSVARARRVPPRRGERRSSLFGTRAYERENRSSLWTRLRPRVSGAEHGFELSALFARRRGRRRARRAARDRGRFRCRRGRRCARRRRHRTHRARRARRSASRLALPDAHGASPRRRRARACRAGGACTRSSAGARGAARPTQGNSVPTSSPAQRSPNMPASRAGAITTRRPQRQALRAASILLSMPPLPMRAGARRDTLPTRRSRHHADARAARVEHALDVGEQDQSSAPTSGATIAASWSLSPKWISSVATVSFSLTIGTAPASSSAASASRALFSRSRSARSAWVKSTCAAVMPSARERLVVAPHEHALPRGRRGLEPRHLLRARPVAEPLAADGDRAARHDHDRALGRAKLRHLASEPRNHLRVAASMRDPIFTTMRRAARARFGRSRRPHSTWCRGASCGARRSGSRATLTNRQKYPRGADAKAAVRQRATLAVRPRSRCRRRGAG